MYYHFAGEKTHSPFRMVTNPSTTWSQAGGEGRFAGKGGRTKPRNPSYAHKDHYIQQQLDPTKTERKQFNHFYSKLFMDYSRSTFCDPDGGGWMVDYARGYTGS